MRHDDVDDETLICENTFNNLEEVMKENKILKDQILILEQELKNLMNYQVL